MGGKDKGGTAAGDKALPEVWLGADLGSNDGRVTIAVVHNDGPAERAGISPGDELVAIDGLRINVAGAEARTRRYKPGDKSRVTVFRGDELMTLQLRWEEAPTDTCFLTVDDQAEEAAAARRAAWLGR